jgi:hypothetical protein
MGKYGNTVSSKSWSIISKLHKLKIIYVAELYILFKISFFHAYCFVKYILWNLFFDSNICAGTQTKIIVLVLR